jgi:hypothetical protein
MTSPLQPTTSPPQKLAALLETLPSEDRQEITAWFLSRSDPSGPSAMFSRSREGRQALASLLPAGDSQLVTIRLPADSHGKLRAWCADHNFTMAAVVRGLVERFLEDQTPKN